MEDLQVPKLTSGCDADASRRADIEARCFAE